MSNEEKDWQKTLEKHTLSSYRRFLKRHPNSRFVDEALANVRKINDEIRWRNVTDDHSVWAYEHYLHNFPDGKYVEQAKDFIAVLKEELMWAKVQDKKSIRPFIDYISHYPTGRFVEEAESRIRELERKVGERSLYERAMRERSKELFQKYINNYPNGLFVEEAVRELLFLEKIHERINMAEGHQKIQQKTEEVDWTIAKTKNTYDAYGDFFKKYPNGKYTKQAELRLKELDELQLKEMLEEQDDKMWQMVRRDRMITDCLEYMKRFPEGRHIEKVRHIMDNYPAGNVEPGSKPSFADRLAKLIGKLKPKL